MTINNISIGRFSAITRITKKALRYYDNRGLLVPEAKNSITGYRYYTSDQIQHGLLIKQLSTLGFSIEEISEYLEAYKKSNRDTLDRIIESRLKETRAELERLQRVASLLDNNRSNELMKKTLSEPTIKEEPQIRVISKKEQGVTTETVGRLLAELMQVIHTPENQSNLVTIAGPPATIYHDREYNKEEGELEVVIPITGKITLNEPETEIKNLPKRKVVSLVHKGSYETIGYAYQKIFEYATANGLKVIGPVMEIYLNDPFTVAPNEVLTEIQATISVSGNEKQ